MIVIDDSLTQPNWNFVGVTGFDVIRADVPPLMNSQRDGPVTQGWELTADAPYWNIFLDYNYDGTGGIEGVGDPTFGRRRGLSRYQRRQDARELGLEPVPRPHAEAGDRRHGLDRNHRLRWQFWLRSHHQLQRPVTKN